MNCDYFIRHNLIRSLLVTLLGGIALAGCGSDDKLPGGTNPGDQDPLSVGTPLFYIERQISEDTTSLTDPLEFVGGGRLIMKARADRNAKEVNLGRRACSGNCDFRDLDVSFDGRFVIFAARAEDPEPDDNVQYTWDLFEYDIEDDSMRKVLATDDSSKFNHEITPRYLPSGDIVFASTRQKSTREINLETANGGAYSGLEEDRNERALNLHVMSATGLNIRQITFNMSHDAYPVVLPDGSILYTRWDNFGRNAMNLYRVNPDGTGNQIIYGMHSHDTGSGGSDLQFVKSNILPDGDLFVLARPMDSDFYGGDFMSIDIGAYVDNTTPTARTNGSGPAQQSITDTNVNTGAQYSTGGYYADFHPLWDGTNRALASWSLCRVQNGELIQPCNSDTMNASGARPADPAYGIWMLDYSEDTQTPIIPGRSGVLITDVALGYDRTAPLTFFDEQPFESNNCLSANFKLGAATQTEMCEGQEGVIHIRNIYETDGLLSFAGTDMSGTYADIANPTTTDADSRPARFLRIVKGVPEPDRDIRQPDGAAFGRAGAQRMKEILGYAPIEPDGSVKVRVPANVPLMVSITDADGKRLTARHQNWLSVRPGEILECKGCHTRNSTEPHGRFYAQPDTTNPGETNGSTYTGATVEVLSPYSYTVSGEILNATMAEAKFYYVENQMNSSAQDIIKLNQDPRYTYTWLDSVNSPLTEADMELESSSVDRLAAAPWYNNLPTYVAGGYDLPTNNHCENWNYRCRIRINYPDHIQPLWEFTRALIIPASLGGDGMTATPTECTNCHSRVDAMAAPQVPAGQLELTNQVDTGIRMRSYEELFFADIALVDDGMGNVVTCTIDVPRVDENGDPVLDEEGNQIIDTEFCPETEGPYVSANGAFASSRFFNMFAPGASHEDFLTPAELRLIAEWLDIGGQYYNDLFAAPEAN
ncbi:MAG: hypothetical protein VYA55_01775 [Pseudomonadota bacterium]|nr:hypothetical protein [Pseudomonadota bacterium]